MNDYHKHSIIRGAVLFLVALVVFLTVVMLTGGGRFSYVLPLLAEGYGLYAFFKKYYPPEKDDREEKKEGKQ